MWSTRADATARLDPTTSRLTSAPGGADPWAGPGPRGVPRYLQHHQPRELRESDHHGHTRQLDGSPDARHLPGAHQPARRQRLPASGADRREIPVLSGLSDSGLRPSVAEARGLRLPDPGTSTLRPTPSLANSLSSPSGRWSAVSLAPLPFAPVARPNTFATHRRYSGRRKHQFVGQVGPMSRISGKLRVPFCARPGIIFAAKGSPA